MMRSCNRSLFLVRLLLPLAIFSTPAHSTSPTPIAITPAISAEKSELITSPSVITPPVSSPLMNIIKQNTREPRVTLLNAQQIQEYCQKHITALEQNYAALIESSTTVKSPLNAINLKNEASLITPWNTLQAQEEDLSGLVGLFVNVSPIQEVREAAEHCELKLNEFNLSILQNPKLYQLLTAIPTHDPIELRWKTMMLRQFREAGSGLLPAQQLRLKAISTELDSLTQAFERAMRDNNTTLLFTDAELAGVSEAFFQGRSRDEQGRLRIGLSYPEYEAIMGYAERESTRKALYLAFTQRGGVENLDRLNRIVKLRGELANILGERHYAQWVLAERMARTPDEVHEFLNQVADKVEAIEANDRNELRKIKLKHLNVMHSSLNRWDVLFYENKLKQQRYAVDQENFRRYFPPDAAVQWMFFIAKQLYGIEFLPVPTAEIWHPDVKVYALKDSHTQQMLGTLYLDLYPRKGKYNHAAAFGIRTRSQLLERYPISVLVTNLNSRGLTHSELETLLHEFGHTLHGLLSEARFILHGGTRVERDFVEAPSQMLEEWTRHRETLNQLAKFCKPGCPVLDNNQIDKLNAARLLNRGIFYARQLLYSRYDMGLAEGLPECTNAFNYWKQMESETPWGYLENSQFPGTFGHIAGSYAAGYYGYMWSEVLALDMATQFRGHWLDGEIGQRFRKRVLAEGGQRPADELVRSFLGRKPNPAYFFQEITGQRK
ncbi:MAG: M3 family metallopeptidase [Pseudomonadota bacterium]